MFWRTVWFLAFQLAGGVAGFWLFPSGNDMFGAAFGAMSAGLLWFVTDLRRGYGVLVWLRDGDASRLPILSGVWSEVASRVRRLMADRDRSLRDGDNRLKEFLAAIQASPNGVVLLDASGKIEWFNQMAAEHFGFVSGRDLMQQIGNLVRAPEFADYYAGSDYTKGVFLPGRASTSTRPVRLSVHLYRYGEGRKLLMSSDVTALEQADAMRRDFVANVSHEIRTPLTVLGGFVETMQNLPLDAPERQRYLALMAQQAKRMQTLVNDLLTLSRLEGSPPPPTSEWVDVRGLVAQCEREGQELSALMGQPGHQFKVEVEHDCLVAGSSAELVSAMANLVNNAVRYTPVGGRIGVRWALEQDGSGEFSVTDSGPGIAPEHIPRLTERFYRIDRSRSRETGGTGLGLAIVKHVAQRHGAHLTIESRLGMGSRFAIRLPPDRVRLAAPLRARASSAVMA